MPDCQHSNCTSPVYITVTKQVLFFLDYRRAPIHHNPRSQAREWLEPLLYLNVVSILLLQTGFSTRHLNDLYTTHNISML